MRSQSRIINSGNVPAWARGTFIWRLNLADRPDALVDGAEAIAAVANRLDHAVEHIVFLSGAIGADEGKLPWDGVWPYWQRLSYRIGGGWEELSRFMVAMRDRHRAQVSFHVNCTDVNAGLRLYPETRAFFERLVEAKAIYARPQGFNAQPWFGLPYVPETISDADPSHMFAMVNYQRYWESGLAKEQIDRLYEHTAPPIRYSWGHGGLARNDYGQIGSGYGTGTCDHHGDKGMHVYGNQGSYTLHLINRGRQPMTVDGKEAAGTWSHNGDHALKLSLCAGPHRLAFRKERLYAKWSDGAEAEWTIEGGFRAWHGDMILGLGGDRFCPDTWSGEQRILIYSQDGSDRRWTLPENWAEVDAALLHPLTSGGRGDAVRLTIKDRQVVLSLLPQVPYVLVPMGVTAGIYEMMQEEG